MRRPLLISAVLALSVTVAACGSGESASSSKPKQTVAVEMTDNAFSKPVIEVTAGEPVEITFTNTGKVDHEAIVGDAAMQMAHEKEMSQTSTTEMGGMDETTTMGGMGHGTASSAEALTVKPGKTGTLTYTFKKSDDGILIGCHEPGHYDSGMKIKVSVKA